MNTGTSPNTSPNPNGAISAISAIVVAPTRCCCTGTRSVAATSRDLSRKSSSKFDRDATGTPLPASKSAKQNDSQGSTGGCCSSSSSSSSSSSVSSAPSTVVSSVSALPLAAKKDNEAPSSKEPVHDDGTNIPFDQGERISENAASPAFIRTEKRPLATAAAIFTPRKRELHFLSNQFRQDVESWMLLDVISDSDSDDDSDDDDDDDDDETNVCKYGEEDALADSTTTSTVEYTGTLNLEARHDSYRYSHEKGALSFAVDLLASVNGGR